jgi:hypothetical protein
VPTYVYRRHYTAGLLHLTEEREITAPTYEPEKYKPGPEWELIIQPSMILFGDFEQGDDDFSRRYWLNGANESSKPNRTQGTTNVNAVMRKWGKKGMPLEARTDIDPMVSTNRPLPQYENSDLPAGHMPAPAALTPAVQLPHTSDFK